jgi:molecular chaperone GrpE
MSDPKGPKLDLPDDLVAEIDADTSADAAAAADTPALAEPSAHDAEPAAADPSDDLAAWKDRHLRLAAEFENFKRRALKERQDLLNFATEDLVKELLATIDNLERALGHVHQEGDVDKENLVEGVELTFRSLMHTLEKSGVNVVEAEGKPFDPKVH